MALRFPEHSTVRTVARSVWHRLGGPSQWHNRAFASGQAIEAEGDGYTIHWDGHGTVRARGIADLPCRGERGSILASGPSVGDLTGVERLFDQPVACVNGSVVLAAELGRRVDYYFVSDYRFILDKPDLFRIGTQLADATVLCPMSVFAAMLATPDAIAAANLHLREDLRRPFKRERLMPIHLRTDPTVIADSSGRLAFSLDPCRGTFPAGTVVYDALQVLFGIGYRELFMFGVDLSDEPRFYREEMMAPLELARAYADRIEPAFELVARYLRRTGRRLVNGSLRSRLPGSIIPKVDGTILLDELARRREGWRAARAA